MDFYNEYVLMRDGNEVVDHGPEKWPIMRRASKLSRIHKRGCLPSYYEVWHYFTPDHRVLAGFWN